MRVAQMACIEESRSLISKGASRTKLSGSREARKSVSAEHGAASLGTVNLIFTPFLCVTLRNDVTCCGIFSFINLEVPGAGLLLEKKPGRRAFLMSFSTCQVPPERSLGLSSTPAIFNSSSCLPKLLYPQLVLNYKF